MNPQENIPAQAAKVVTVWAAIGITSWAEAASFLAFLYSLALLAEWTWKKIARPLMVRYGFVPADRRHDDQKGDQ